MLIIIDINGAE